MTYEPGHTNYLRALQNVRAEMTLTANETNPILPASYQGYIGEKQGKLAYGEREDGMIVRVSGERARHVAALIKEKNIAGKTTRIDFQVTGKTQDATENYLSKVQSRVLSTVGSAAGRRAKNTSTYKNRGRDCGMVIGSRSSENYHRIYDKSLEQRNRIEPNLVRFENEVKGKRARVAWNMYQAAAQPYYLSCSIVKAEFELLGVNMDWLASGERNEFPSSYEASDLQKKMNWFESHVKKSVAECVEFYGREAVLQSLGLDVK